MSSALLVLTASIFLLFEDGSWFSSVVEPAGSDGAVAGDRSIGVVGLLLSLPDEPLVQSDTPLLACNANGMRVNVNLDINQSNEPGKIDSDEAS